ncbi:MAG TPA: hypothetical protein PK054_12370 [Anaerohalosphaeraceae bacterium]|nr:hypothetical protein [Anaerohalosphaeraceae bacterium]HOL88981.1 hypothetical protein [Anaerohalosphaeraceae bacterium]HPP57360.1 hypothetical protein [Anaerohalosphaeraceae bacterium]
MMKRCGLIWLMLLLAGVPVWAVIYVDAEGGASGNTARASDGDVDAWWTTATAPDGLWGRRAFGYDQQGVFNGTTKDIFESSGTGSGREDSVAILTTVSGLTPGQLYQVDVVYWSSNSQNWCIRAGFALDAMLLFDRLGDVNSGAIAGTRIEGIQDGDRWVFTGTIGTIAADGNGRIRVYLDDKPSDASQGGWYDRTWYDGLALKEVPEPTTCLLAAAGALLGIRRRK